MRPVGKARIIDVDVGKAGPHRRCSGNHRALLARARFGYEKCFVATALADASVRCRVVIVRGVYPLRTVEPVTPSPKLASQTIF